MSATQSMLTSDQVEALKKEAEAAKIEADKLRAKWQKARELLEALTLEACALPARKSAAVIEGQLEEYAEVLRREGMIKAELVLVEVSTCRAAIRHFQSYKDWAVLYRTYCRANAELVGGPEYPFGMAKGIAAENELGNALSIVSSATPPLGDANRQLEALIIEASKPR